MVLGATIKLTDSVITVSLVFLLSSYVTCFVHTNCVLPHTIGPDRGFVEEVYKIALLRVYGNYYVD